MAVCRSARSRDQAVINPGRLVQALGRLTGREHDRLDADAKLLDRLAAGPWVRQRIQVFVGHEQGKATVLACPRGIQGSAGEAAEILRLPAGHHDLVGPRTQGDGQACLRTPMGSGIPCACS